MIGCLVSVSRLPRERASQRSVLALSLPSSSPQRPPHPPRHRAQRPRLAPSLTGMASIQQNYSIPVTFPTGVPSSIRSIPILSSFATDQDTLTTWLFTSLAVVTSLLALEQGVYRYKKGNLPGSTWTIPVIGKFLDSMHPTLENYKKQWASGALSAVSVFNM